MGIFTCLTSGEQKCGKTKFKAIDYCRNRAYSTNLKIFTRCQLGPWIGMGYRDLNRFAVKLLGKLEGALDGLGRLPWQPDDKIAVHHDAQPLAVLHKHSGLFDGRTFLDILKNLR